MEFIQIAYCCTAPFLLLLGFIFRRSFAGKTAMRALAVSNLLLILYGFFVLRQLLGIYQLGQTAKNNFHVKEPAIAGELLRFFIRQSIVIGLPLLFLFRKWRTNGFLSACMLVLLFWDHPVAYWNFFNAGFKILGYVSLFTAAYSVLWLTHQLPEQTRS